MAGPRPTRDKFGDRVSQSGHRRKRAHSRQKRPGKHTGRSLRVARFGAATVEAISGVVPHVATPETAEACLIQSTRTLQFCAQESSSNLDHRSCGFFSSGFVVATCHLESMKSPTLKDTGREKSKGRAALKTSRRLVMMEKMESSIPSAVQPLYQSVA